MMINLSRLVIEDLIAHSWVSIRWKLLNDPPEISHCHARNRVRCHAIGEPIALSFALPVALVEDRSWSLRRPISLDYSTPNSSIDAYVVGVVYY